MSDPVFCNDCETAIRLEQDRDGTHILRCGCDKDVSIPTTWSYASWE